ncbi:MAG: hypothetical protein JWL99_168 [Streptomyces oryziradicis]|nr:hypothetical protein [Actinacidiphila oryziradicis]
MESVRDRPGPERHRSPAVGVGVGGGGVVRGRAEQGPPVRARSCPRSYPQARCMIISQGRIAGSSMHDSTRHDSTRDPALRIGPAGGPHGAGGGGRCGRGPGAARAARGPGLAGGWRRPRVAGAGYRGPAAAGRRARVRPAAVAVGRRAPRGGPASGARHSGAGGGCGQGGLRGPRGGARGARDLAAGRAADHLRAGAGCFAGGPGGDSRPSGRSAGGRTVPLPGRLPALGTAARSGLSGPALALPRLDAARRPVQAAAGLVPRPPAPSGRPGPGSRMPGHRAATRAPRAGPSPPLPR